MENLFQIFVIIKLKEKIINVFKKQLYLVKAVF